MNLVLATKNPGKLRELKELAQGFDWLELELAPDQFDPEETGNTFIENAIIKAKAAAEMTGKLSIADDSGIAVDALNGAPGIRSARYCPGSDTDRRRKLLDDLHSIPDDQRGGAFVCAMALCDDTGNVLHTTLREWRGVIARDERGENGFGYDPIFYLPDLNQTSAQISPAEKNARSHRGQAWRAMLEFLDSLHQKVSK
ncbi:MAG: RdgB/HAM1 family non-canonical purine NTP pyrophosphatase [Cyanobacteria bacterium SZAS LIN-5]|nr:RdgB/HAM1 family non-canonical purine NTP pyrophosphatase [Cyanobacteria bacterium SZAS LIN-5]RTL45285.1 MAG: RdgB/HAM1 family non-canonical purine NTP pyrophosphatase [Candidatus Melainabacteria bacterium]